MKHFAMEFPPPANLIAKIGKPQLMHRKGHRIAERNRSDSQC
jgi:hypothetical protein